MSEEERRRVIRLKLARMQNRADSAIPTGFPALDEALGIGGLPRGRMVELFGPSSAGKTTLALQIVAHMQRSGSTVAWIDADRALDPAHAASLSVNLEGLPVAQPESAEEAMEVARQLAVSGALDLLIVDSAAALVPRVELETALGESGSGMQSRVLASALGKLSAVVVRTGVVILFLNQTRGGGGSEVSAGGPALKLYCAVRILLEPAGRSAVRFRILKNKVGAPFAEGQLQWENASGFMKTP